MIVASWVSSLRFLSLFLLSDTRGEGYAFLDNSFIWFYIVVEKLQTAAFDLNSQAIIIGFFKQHSRIIWIYTV